ncbi:VOC family protein [Sphingobium sp. AP50]|uniref:VOC family protein n=1 Tax=Sphingobium sp. AP50 TaxID=1884369 RepID=UPI0015A5BFB1|nr:VOC family protein [Sphingobium sp. AP50]
MIGVAHTGITVSDMSRALNFFGDGLGASVSIPILYDDPMFERITGVPGAQIEIAYAEFPGHRLELLRYTHPVSQTPNLAQPSDPGHFHLALMVEDIDKIITKLGRFGFTSAGPVVHVQEPAFSVIYTYGFDNLVIELMDHSAPPPAPLASQ